MQPAQALRPSPQCPTPPLGQTPTRPAHQRAAEHRTCPWTRAPHAGRRLIATHPAPSLPAPAFTQCPTYPQQPTVAKSPKRSQRSTKTKSARGEGRTRACGTGRDGLRMKRGRERDTVPRRRNTRQLMWKALQMRSCTEKVGIKLFCFGFT